MIININTRYYKLQIADVLISTFIRRACTYPLNAREPWPLIRDIR